MSDQQFKVHVNEDRTVWCMSNHQPHPIRLTINRPAGPQRFSEFGEMPPMIDITLGAGLGAVFTLDEPILGEWVAELRDL